MRAENLEELERAIAQALIKVRELSAQNALPRPPSTSTLPCASRTRSGVGRVASPLGARVREAYAAGVGILVAADMAALEGVLVAVSQLLADIPELAELDINPLIAMRVISEALSCLRGPVCPKGVMEVTIMRGLTLLRSL